MRICNPLGRTEPEMPVLPPEVESLLRFIEVANGLIGTIALIMIAARTGKE
jgi:hypothetical protein